MSNTKLSAIVRQSALLTPEKDTFWPISDQYIGLEMEIERFSNKELDNHRMAGSPFWTEHQDGSLRNGVELVLSQALMGTSLREAISYFFRTFTKYSVTPRTSIHVHVNMRQDNETVEGLRNMVSLYYMYEDAFFMIADQNRKWCAYCNAFEDNPPAILEAFMNTDLGTDDLTRRLTLSSAHNTNRYYGLNLNALNKFGTIEFRHFPLVTDESRLIDWLKLIMELKQAGNRMADEGNTPWSVFVTPDDISKLTDYMPTFGHVLMGYVASSRAFHRMISVRNLGINKVADSTGALSKNAAFKIFQEKQKELGKVATPVASKGNKAVTAVERDVGQLRRELDALQDVANRVGRLSAAQNARRVSYEERLDELLRRQQQMTARVTIEEVMAGGFTPPHITGAAHRNGTITTNTRGIRPARVTLEELATATTALTGRPTGEIFRWDQPVEDWPQPHNRAAVDIFDEDGPEREDF